MHRNFLAAAVGSLALISTASAASLFTTSDDFAPWTNTGYTTAPSVVSLDSSTTNGAGNTTTPGGTGVSGSLSVTRTTGGSYGYFYGPGEQGNAAFFTALGSTLTLNGGGGGSITASGNHTIIFDSSTVPTGGTGSYFQLGIVLNYDGHFDQLFPAAGGTVDNGNGTSTTTISYALPAQSLSYFQLGFIFNSDYASGSTFTIDNVRTDVAGVPEPTALAALGFGASSLLRRRR